jgi:hypothetical protein
MDLNIIDVGSMETGVLSMSLPTCDSKPGANFVHSFLFPRSEFLSFPPILVSHKQFLCKLLMWWMLFLNLYISTRKLQEDYSYETLISDHKTTRCHNPENHNLNNYRLENFKTDIFLLSTIFWVVKSCSFVEIYSSSETSMYLHRATLNYPRVFSHF